MTYICNTCEEYFYDEATGDTKNNIKAGTAFKDLPATWTCPNCKAKKEAFGPAPKSEDMSSKMSFINPDEKN